MTRTPFAATAGLLLVLTLAGCDGGGESGAQAQSAAPPPKVTVAAPLIRKLTEWDEFTGRFEPVQQVEVRGRVSGYIESIHFEDGQLVEPGQLLFIIDPRPYEAVVQSRRADVVSAESQLRLAQLEEGRSRRLVSTNAQAEATLDQRAAERQSREAAVELARAQLRTAELDLEFTNVTSPLKGRVSDRRVDVGNLVEGQTMLTTIVQLDPVHLIFDMSENDYLAYTRAVAAGELSSTRDNQTMVESHLVDEEGWPHKGTMNFVDNVVDRGSGTIRGRAVFPNPEFLITSGQFGRIRIPGSPEQDTLLIPDSAIVTDQSRKMVLTVGQDGKVVPKVVRPGPSQPGGLRILRNGVVAQDRVIIDGLARARPGMQVEVQEGKIEPLLPQS